MFLLPSHRESDFKFCAKRIKLDFKLPNSKGIKIMMVAIGELNCLLKGKIYMWGVSGEQRAAADGSLPTGQPSLGTLFSTNTCEMMMMLI